MRKKHISHQKHKKRNRWKRVKIVWGIVALLLIPLMLCLALTIVISDKEEERAPEEVVNSESFIEVAESSETVYAKVLLNEMTLEERIYQMFIVTPEQLTGVDKVTQSGNMTKNALEKYPVGGVIYFADNIVSREQCMTMISSIQQYSKVKLFIAVDEEGGKVARIGKNPSMGTTSFPDMETIGGSADPQKAYRVGYTIGTEISEIGFNLDFAPVADVFSNPNNTVIGSRAFSSDAYVAAEMVAACVQGFGDSGILCTLKHFPGHGDTEKDSHYEIVEIQKNLEELHECELIPFQEGIAAGAPLVMVGHINVPEIINENVPASLSKEIVTELLRGEMEFEGIVITDSMSMEAITEEYSSSVAAVKAIQAGVDVILMPQELESAVQGILEAVESGEITIERINESVLRILESKIRSGIVQMVQQDENVGN